jgi:hypothetical protein
MLPASLLKFQIRSGRVSPVTITDRWLPVAEKIIKIFRESTGKKKKEIEKALEEYEYGFQKYQVVRGLCKVSEDWLVFRENDAKSSEEVRRLVFETAAKLRPITLSRKSLLARTAPDVYKQVSDQTGIPQSELQETLYCDLESNHVLQGISKNFTAKNLVNRYNLALHQGLLYFASRLDVFFQGNLKLVWTHLKLSNLMYYIFPTNEKGTLHLVLNGPVSVLRFSQKYGVNMSRFLPALVHCGRWRIKAQLLYKDQKHFYESSEKNGLVSHYKKNAAFDSRVERNFFHNFRKLGSDWTIKREGGIIILKGGAAIPDFKFTHKKNGKTAYLEIVGYWTPEYLAHKLKLYNQVFEESSARLVMAVSSYLNCAEGDFGGNVIRFKGTLSAKDVLERLSTDKN